MVRQGHGVVNVRTVEQNRVRALRPISLNVPPCLSRSITPSASHSIRLSVSLSSSLPLSLSSQGRALRWDREKSKDGEREARVSHEFPQVGPVRRHACCSCQTGPCQSTHRNPRPGRDSKTFHRHSRSFQTQTLQFRGLRIS